MAKRRRINLTNDITVRNLKWKPGDPEQFRLRDIDRMGWYIRITKQGRKTWEYRYPIGSGKYRYLAYGHFPKMGCAEALDEYKKYYGNCVVIPSKPELCMKSNNEKGQNTKVNMSPQPFIKASGDTPCKPFPKGVSHYKQEYQYRDNTE